jgi:hypothetical protein
VLVVLVISMLVVLAHQEQVFYLVAVVVVQVFLALAQTHLQTMAVTAVQVEAVEAVLLLVALLAQAATALSIFTTRE